MKIRFIKTLATQRQCFVVGSEHEVDDAEANRLIAGGVGVAVGKNAGIVNQVDAVPVPASGKAPAATPPDDKLPKPKPQK